MREADTKVLGALTTHEHCSTAELSEITGLDTPSVRQAVVALIARGLLTAVPDGNSIAWKLSQRGRAFAESVRRRAILDVPSTPRTAR
ncbi:MarR family transcriptional regulator [Nocardia sp. NBC_01377]|uniref:MarR family transcriptional regulator n=1 Tax=Nocardia sp. NBC_01377 TaxID=2903595 RepID=UPI0038696E1B